MTTLPAPTATDQAGALASLQAAFRAGRRRLLGYLTATAILVVVTVWGLPATPAETPDPSAAQRLEYIPIQGDGPFAPVSRASLRTTAWLAASTVDGQAAMLRPTPLAARVGIPSPGHCTAGNRVTWPTCASRWSRSSRCWPPRSRSSAQAAGPGSWRWSACSW